MNEGPWEVTCVQELSKTINERKRLSLAQSYSWMPEVTKEPATQTTSPSLQTLSMKTAQALKPGNSANRSLQRNKSACQSCSIEFTTKPPSTDLWATGAQILFCLQFLVLYRCLPPPILRQKKKKHEIQWPSMTLKTHTHMGSGNGSTCLQL